MMEPCPSFDSQFSDEYILPFSPTWVGDFHAANITPENMFRVRDENGKCGVHGLCYCLQQDTKRPAGAVQSAVPHETEPPGGLPRIRRLKMVGGLVQAVGIAETSGDHGKTGDTGSPIGIKWVKGTGLESKTGAFGGLGLAFLGGLPDQGGC